MTRLVRLGVGVAVAGVVALGTGGVASAKSGNACTYLEAPPGQYVSFVAQEIGHSGTLNPGTVRGVSGICGGPPA